VHAAGNDGADTGVEPSFPTPVYSDGGRAANWIEVGASSWRGADSLAAPFSNYSRERGDQFSPGVDVMSTMPHCEYESEDGKRMAAPVVTGVAALVWAYYPNLTAAQLKQVLLESATRHPDRQVLRPGTQGERIPFGSLSATGGIVNAYEALRRAAAMSGGR
jgi:subtilisin family serine protease